MVVEAVVVDASPRPVALAADVKTTLNMGNGGVVVGALRDSRTEGYSRLTLDWAQSTALNTR